jgi:hypothetical protein
VSFAERVLGFTFSGAASGSFTASGLRAAANIQATQGRIGVMAQVKIWGLSLDQMNTYSTAISSAISSEIPNANLVIDAGDLGDPLSQVFNGPIWQSYIDLTEAPESAFIVSAVGIANAATPIASQSVPPPQPGTPSVQNAEQLIENICTAAGLRFQNNGAHAVLRNQVTYGSGIDQITRIATAARFNWKHNGNAVTIWPQDGTVDDVVVNVGPSTDPEMVGYPAYWENGIIVTSLFNQEVQVGRQMNVTSSIPKANGTWSIIQVQHNLTTMIPKGPWFTVAQLTGTGT